MEIELPTQMSEKMSASLKCGRRPFDYFHSGQKDCHWGSKLWITWRAIFVSHWFKTVTSDGIQVFYNGSQRVTRPTQLWSKERETSEVWNSFPCCSLYRVVCRRLYEACKTDVFLPKGNLLYSFVERASQEFTLEARSIITRILPWQGRTWSV